MLAWLEVNVGRTVLDCLSDEEVDVANDRRFLNDLLEFRQVVVGITPDIENGAEVVQLVARAVVPVDGGKDISPSRDNGLDLALRDDAEVVHRQDVCGVRRGNKQLAFVVADRDRGVPTTHGSADAADGRAVHRVIAEVDEAKTDL